MMNVSSLLATVLAASALVGCLEADSPHPGSDDTTERAQSVAPVEEPGEAPSAVVSWHCGGQHEAYSSGQQCPPAFCPWGQDPPPLTRVYGAECEATQHAGSTIRWVCCGWY
jgi:hypothetical protein